ncbi:hypothetical protein BH10PSE4_BH10PSE4_39680 [soil metagenome]
MPIAIVLLASSLVTLIAIIGLADALTHLLCGVARALKAPEAVRASSPSTETRRLAS